jgi:hypothetical protein
MRLAANFENLTELRADLDAIGDGLNQALTAGLAQDAQALLAETKAGTPYGPGPRAGAKGDDALPHIRDMLNVDVRGGTIAIIATHPGAIVHEYGGTISPHGTPITIARAAMARKAAVRELPAMEQNIQDRIDQLAREHGL